jgi:hypothetical protein
MLFSCPDALLLGSACPSAGLLCGGSMPGPAPCIHCTTHVPSVVAGCAFIPDLGSFRPSPLDPTLVCRGERPGVLRQLCRSGPPRPRPGLSAAECATQGQSRAIAWPDGPQLGHQREPARHSTPQHATASPQQSRAPSLQQHSRACCVCQDRHVSRARTHVRTPGPARGTTGPHSESDPVMLRVGPARQLTSTWPAQQNASTAPPGNTLAQHSPAQHSTSPAPWVAAASQHQQCVPKFPGPWARGKPALSLPCGGRQGAAPQGSSLGYSSGFVRVSAAQSDGAAGQPA